MRKVLDAVEGVPSPLSTRAIEDRVRGNTEARRTAIARLVDEGFLKENEGPRKAVLHERTAKLWTG